MIAVQSSSRSLIVDTLPIPKQQLGSAWGEISLHDKLSKILIT
jgi:hypothetical protein